MAFQAMMSGAECSTSNNALGQFMKHTQSDRSLQQDHVGPARMGVPGASSFRSAGPAGPMSSDAPQGVPNQMDLFARAGGEMRSNAFDLGHLKDPLDQIRLGSGAPPGAAPADMEAAFRASQQPHMAHTGGPAPMRSSVVPHGWQEQFDQTRTGSPFSGHSASPGPAQAQQRPMGSGGAVPGMAMGMGGMGMMGRPMMSSVLRSGSMGQSLAQQPRAAEDQRFTELSDEKWEAEFAKLDEQVEDESQEKGKGKAKEDESLPADSGERVIKMLYEFGEDMPQETESAKLAEGKGKAEEGESRSEPAEGLSDEGIQKRVVKMLDELESEKPEDAKNSSDRFEALWNSMHEHAANQGPAKSDAELAQWEANLMRNNDMEEDMILNARTPDHILQQDAAEEAFLNGIGTMDANGFPRLGEYKMQASNPFLTHPDPLGEGLRLLADGGSLSDATLLFEAATQRDVAGGTGGEADEVSRASRERSEAWRRLGEAHAMNEMEVPAIRALEQAIEIDDNNLEAYIPLAVSYTNEGYDMPAWQTLKRYIGKAYPHLKPSTGTVSSGPWEALNETTNLFLQAAREGAAKGVVDPEVQVGLGVLFFSDQSYDQAKDCFQTALGVRPNDFLLWNRLGAVLANSGNSEEAISAYQRALELRPTFTRAIYNLSVSCLNLGAHYEAAEHLLAAIALQRNTVIPQVPREEGKDGFHIPDDTQESQSLWSTLRRIFVAMDRMDLASKAHVGTSLNEFKSLGFEF